MIEGRRLERKVIGLKSHKNEHSKLTGLLHDSEGHKRWHGEEVSSMAGSGSRPCSVIEGCQEVERKPTSPRLRSSQPHASLSMETTTNVSQNEIESGESMSQGTKKSG